MTTEMDMEKYWPEHKVHLYILLALFPTQLRDSELTVQKLDRYFHAGSVEGVIKDLRAYSRENYFQFQTFISSKYEQRLRDQRDLIFGTDDPNSNYIPSDMGYSGGLSQPHVKCDAPLSNKQLFGIFGELEKLSHEQQREYLRFKLKNIDSEKARNELGAYAQSLLEAKSAVQTSNLLSVMARQYQPYNRPFVISYNDLYEETPSADSTLWEPVLGLYFDGQIELEDVGYRDFPAKGGETVNRPYVQLKIISKDLQNELRARKNTLRRSKKKVSSEILKYNGLEFDGTFITYGEKSKQIPFQHREVVRVFLKRPDFPLVREVFTKNDEIFANPPYNDIYTTLSKLIAAVHSDLKEVVGKKCIFNKSKESWYLKIE